MRKYKSRAPEFLKDLQDQAMLFFAASGYPSGLAEDAASSFARHMCNHWGGQLIYFPMGLSLARSTRDMEMYRAWQAGTPVPEIAKKYNTSEQWAYAIIDDMRAEDLARRQPELTLETGT